VIDLHLEREYNARAAVPEHPLYFRRWKEEGAAARASLPGFLDLAYGDDPEERLDLFIAKPSRGLLVFFHGGYWRAFGKEDFSWIAPPLVREGWSVSVVGYGLCPRITLGELVEQCRRSVAWLASHFPELGPLVLSGHSAGGHLVAMLWTTEWRIYGLATPQVQGGLSISGIFDLEPLLRTSVNVDLRLDLEEAKRLSPIQHRPRLAAPLVAAVGQKESQEFRRQSQRLAAVWPGVRYLELEGMHHFSALDALVDTAGPLWRALLEGGN